MPKKTRHVIPPDIADYDRSNYNYSLYWQGRQYENRAEQLALKKLLPGHGEKLIDLGGGFGRLTPLYSQLFAQSVLFDYSQNNLREAQIRFEQQGIKNVQVVQGNLYDLPFDSNQFDAALMVRVIHHLEKPALVMQAVNHILTKEGIFILEFANKIHLKARLSAWLKGDFNFTKDLTPLKKTNQNGIFYNYHPRYIKDLLQKTNFRVLRKISVSNLRSPLLKKLLPVKILLIFEKLLQGISKLSLTHFFFGPSIFLLCQKGDGSKSSP